MVTTENLYEVITELLTGPSITLNDHPFSQQWAHNRSKKLPRSKIGSPMRPNDARYNGGFYWQPMGRYHCSTQQYHYRSLGACFPPKRGSQKIHKRCKIV